jgi:1,4-dihydroxy-2-naphthoate octaprenyltransferase
MNWPLVFKLSLFGLAMAIGTVFVIPSNIEPIFWLVIFVICAVLIAQYSGGRNYLHGQMLGIVNSVWVTGAHLIFFDRYVANHQAEVQAFASAPLSPRVMMAIVGPVIGVISGAVIGLLAALAAKILKPRGATA